MDIKRSRDQLFQIVSSSEIKFCMKIFTEKLDRVICGHLVPELGKDWSKIDPKWLKHHYQACKASEDLFSISHEKQKIFFHVKVHALGIEALIWP